MNSNKKKKLPITLKVLIAHLAIIILLDLNISAYIKKDSNNFDNVKNAQFINLKSISLEEIQRKRALIEEKKRKLEALKKKRKKEELSKKKKLLAEKKKKAEDAKRRKLEEKKRKIEKEKEKKKLAEEKKRKDIQKLKQEEEEKLASYELEKLENELKEIERLEALIKQQNIRNAQLSDAEKRYILAIRSKIENNWLIPHDTNRDKICTAIVNQLPSGKVTSVKIHGCTADPLYIDSLINAVWKSSPLPVAPDIEVYQENIVLQFEGPQ